MAPAQRLGEEVLYERGKRGEKEGEKRGEEVREEEEDVYQNPNLKKR